MTARAGILCAGRVYCDLIFTGVPRLPSMGTEVFAEGLSLHAGGGAFITAAHLASLGRPAGLAATLPAPPFDGVVHQAIDGAHIAHDLCLAAHAGQAPQITVAMAGPEDRAFLTRRSGVAVPRFGPEALHPYRHLHIGEAATLREAPWLIDIARASGLSVSLDCSWDEALGAEIGPLIAQVDVFLPNADEVAMLTRLGLSPPWATLTVVKQGAEGATAYHGGKQIHVPALPADPVDTTGAGDAFNAGFLDAWLAKAPLTEALRAGHARAARAISCHGGFAPAPKESSNPGASASIQQT